MWSSTIEFKRLIIKYQGKKLYEYARAGIEVPREPRDAYISDLKVKHLHDDLYEMDVVVSSGTYIRTLITDFCAALDEYGVMTSLVREGIEHITLKDAVTLEELEANIPEVDPFTVLSPEYEIVETQDEASIRNGKHVCLSNASNHVIFTHNHVILAAYEKRDDGLYHCQRGLF